MATYDHKQVIADYASGKISPEMATGHGLQHIDKLYDMFKANKLEWQAKIDVLEARTNLLQTAVASLTTIIEKFRVKRKPSDPKPQNPTNLEYSD